jgi:hypothetical protein
LIGRFSIWAEGGQSVTWIKYTDGSSTSHSTLPGAESDILRAELTYQIENIFSFNLLQFSFCRRLSFYMNSKKLVIYHLFTLKESRGDIEANRHHTVSLKK